MPRVTQIPGDIPTEWTLGSQKQNSGRYHVAGYDCYRLVVIADGERFGWDITWLDRDWGSWRRRRTSAPGVFATRDEAQTAADKELQKMIADDGENA